MEKYEEQATANFLFNDAGRERRLAALDAIMDAGLPLRHPLPQSLGIISWLAENHSLEDTVRLAVEMLSDSGEP